MNDSYYIYYDYSSINLVHLHRVPPCPLNTWISPVYLAFKFCEDCYVCPLAVCYDSIIGQQLQQVHFTSPSLISAQSSRSGLEAFLFIPPGASIGFKASHMNYILPVRSL